jgi:hypothetical protein
MMRATAVSRQAVIGSMALLLAAAPAAAVSTSFWRVDSFEGFAAGDASGVSILEEGAIVLSPGFERVDVPGAGYVWSVVPGPRGAAYLVAGTPGRLYELEGGELTLLFESATADLPVLAVGHGGDVFVGTAPGGQIYRVKPDGTSELFYDTGQGYVWSMAYSQTHGLVVGTGSSAKVLCLDAKGNASVVLESSESSITALACAGDRILAGTSGEGLLLDITPGRAATVLFDSPSEEITAIVPDVGGEIYFASTSVSLDEALEQSDDSESPLGEGAVWRTTPAGGAVGLWESPDVPVTALGPGPDGAVWAGTGATGLIVSIGPRGKSDLVADLEEEEVLSIVSVRDAVLATTGVPGAVYSFGSGVGRSGSYESDVFESGSAARWGEIRWRGETPSGSGVAFRTRSGNTSEPDETWSAWASVESAERSQGPIASPPAQYLQWRVDLTRGAGVTGPILRAVEIAYLEENLPPRLASLVVNPPGEAEAASGGPGAAPSTQTLPSGLEITYGVEPSGVARRQLPSLLRGMRAAEWEVIDPNDDRVRFDVWIRSEDETAWKLIEEGITRTAHAWDTQSMTDGFYRLKVVATDDLDNPAEHAGSDSIVSAPFLVDGTAPSITGLDVRVERGRVTVEGLVEDALSPVDRVEVAVDYGEWSLAFAGDGMFDSPAESFRIEVEDVAAGEHAVAVRATDTAGNSAVVTRIVR